MKISVDTIFTDNSNVYFLSPTISRPSTFVILQRNKKIGNRVVRYIFKARLEYLNPTV